MRELYIASTTIMEHNTSLWVPHNTFYFDPNNGYGPCSFGKSSPKLRWPSDHRYQGMIKSFLVLSIPFALTYCITLWHCKATLRSRKNGMEPALVPYYVPLIGNAISYALSPPYLASYITKRFGTSIIVRLRFFSKETYLISGSENVNTIWKSSKWLTSRNGITIALSNMFGTGRKDIEFFNSDNSNITLDPHPNSRVQPDNRVFYLMHKATLDFLSGSHLVSAAMSFEGGLKNRFDNIPIGHEWVNMPDLYAFLQDHISHATLEAMCGPDFLTLNPTFVRDFWKFDRYMPRLLQGWPRWMMPTAWKARDKCIESMRQWRKSSMTSVNSASTDQTISGNDMIQARWGYFSRMKGLSEDGIASSDLGILWGMNSNSVPSTFWYFWEIFRDPELLSRILCEVDAAISDPMTPSSLKFDTPKLCGQPLLQSVYAETLRLRVAVYIIRKPEFQDATFRGYTLPQDKMLVINSHSAHMDKQNWNTGNEDSHPVGEFWADRFLTFPKDMTTDAAKPEARSDDSGIKGAAPKFSLNGLSGAWIPFGGGIHQCPGRHWVKLQIILSFAVMCSTFEIELTEEGLRAQPDTRKYGLGAMPPKTRTPFRMRRKGP